LSNFEALFFEENVGHIAEDEALDEWQKKVKHVMSPKETSW